MKRIISAFALMCGLMASSSLALNVEDFESYANTGALEASWVDTVNTMALDDDPPVLTEFPIQTVDTSTFHDGSQSMKLRYNLSADPYENQIQFEFEANQNWLAYDTFSVWVRSEDGETSLEKLTIQLKNEFGETLGGAERNTQIGDAWTEWTFDISGFSGLGAVRRISIDVSAVDEANGFGAGTLYFDEMSVVSAIPEPGTMALMILGGVGMLIAVRRKLKA
jgi:hypothetical protein